MTDTEKRRLQGDLLLEYQEAEAHLALLREKAKRVGESLKAVGDWVDKIYRDGWQFDPDGKSYVRGDWVSVKANQNYRSDLNFDAIMELGREVKEAIDHLKDLRGRKEQLGLK